MLSDDAARTVEGVGFVSSGHAVRGVEGDDIAGVVGGGDVAGGC